jgi:hypothetical protein
VTEKLISLHDSSESNALPTTDASALSRLGFNVQFYLRNKPVVIRQFLSSEERDNWTPSALTKLLAGKTVNVRHNPLGIFDLNGRSPSERVISLRKEFTAAAHLIAHSGKYYLQQESLEQFPELLTRIRKPHLVDGLKTVLMSNLWFGGRACKSPLHFDSMDNFLIQAHGRKRVILFPPSAARFLYPARGETYPHCSKVNVFAPDLVRFPLYANSSAHKFEFILVPGDMLYIPVGWWHALESLDVSVSVNLWWLGKFKIVAKKLIWIISRKAAKAGKAAKAAKAGKARTTSH